MASAEDELFDAADKAYQQNASMAANAVEKVLRRLSSRYGVGTNDFRNAVREIWPLLVEEFGTRAANVALDQYKGARALVSDLPDYEPVVSADSIYSQSQVIAASNMIGMRFDDLDWLVGNLSGKASTACYDVSDRALQQWAMQDPAHPKFALVPHPGACGWCLMIASRGFVYASQQTISRQRHTHCKCTPVVSFSEDPVLESYDLKGIEDAYNQAYKEAGSTNRKAITNQLNKDTGYNKLKYAKHKAAQEK